MEGSCASYLPPEIWQMIFHGFDHEGELAHLWTWGRLVSWQFRNNIELVFATKWLQETVINFDLVHKGRPRGHRDITCTFQFKCFVADQYSEKAIWKLDEDREKHNECIREELSGVMLRHDRLIRAAHSIVLLLEKNDTVLPELEWDPAQHEILMDWRRMYNKFLGEKNAYDRDLSNARRDISLRLQRRLDAGAMNQNEYTRVDGPMLKDAPDKSYKSIRRRRFDRQIDRL